MQTGVGFGMDYDERFAFSIERAQRPFLNSRFVEVVNCIQPVKDKLQTAGNRVADIGCGSCAALRALSCLYPLPEYCGFDVSVEVLRLAQRLSPNIVTCLIEGKTFPERHQRNAFDLVITTDALHDMSDPLSVLKNVNLILKQDGIYLLCEPNPNLSHHWSGPMHFGISLSVCLPSATQAPPFAGIGQLGLTDNLINRIGHEAGFLVETQSHVEDLFHVYYVLKKKRTSLL